MYYSIPEALPKEFCNGLYNVAKELDSVEAEVHRKVIQFVWIRYVIIELLG